MMRWWSALVAAALAVAGCSGELPPPSLVDRFRVLAVRAEPPDVEPGGAVALDLLVADPAAPPAGRPQSFLWLACATPAGTSSAACAQFAQAPGAALPGGGELTLAGCDEPAGSLVGGGLCLLGSAATAAYVVPPEFLAAGDEARDVTVFVAAATGATSALGCVVEMAEQGSLAVDCQVSYKRLTVSRRARPNHNPALAAVLLDGVPLPADAATAVGAGDHVLQAVAADGAAETFAGADGLDATEALLLSWYLAAPDAGAGGRRPGTVTLYRTELPGEDQTYTAPIAAGPVALWVVVRDDRGGVGWLRRDLTVGGGG